MPNAEKDHRNVANRVTIDEADTHGRVKCNRCKRKLKGGAAEDAVRDKTRPGYRCAPGTGCSS